MNARLFFFYVAVIVNKEEISWINLAENAFMFSFEIFRSYSMIRHLCALNHKKERKKRSIKATTR